MLYVASPVFSAIFLSVAVTFPVSAGRTKVAIEAVESALLRLVFQFVYGPIQPKSTNRWRDHFSDLDEILLVDW